MKKLPLFILLYSGIPGLGMAGGLVWSDRPSGMKAVRACGFDRSNVRNLFTGAVDPRGMVVDAASEKVYFTDRMSGGSLGVINSLPLAGGEVEERLGGLNRPADLRLDAMNRTLFWCEENGGMIRKALLPSGVGVLTPQTLFTGLSAPYYLDFDATRQKLFWGTSSNSLFSGPMAGGVPDPALYSSGQNMRGVCVDAVAGMIYWVERDGPRAIRRRAMTGGPVEDLYTGLDTPHGLVLDLSARKMYWVDTGTQNAGGFNARGVSRGEMDGSFKGAAEVVVAGTSANQPWDIDLDVRVSTYQEWVSRYFRYDAPSVLTEKTADPDGDGRSNFMEYAFDTPPLSGAMQQADLIPRLFPEPHAHPDSPGIIFRKRASATDLDYVPELSWTGLTWVTEAQGEWLYSTIDGEADSGGMCWSRSSLLPKAVPEIGDDPRIFRVKVTERSPD